jgi:hypothetical protein
LDHSISLSHGFLTPNFGFRILGALLGSTSFVESFVAKEIHEDFETIFNLLMFIYPQKTSYDVFVMLHPTLGLLAS